MMMIEEDAKEEEVEAVKKKTTSSRWVLSIKNKTKMIGDESIFWFGFLVIGMGEVVNKTNGVN